MCIRDSVGGAFDHTGLTGRGLLAYHGQAYTASDGNGNFVWNDPLNEMISGHPCPNYLDEYPGGYISIKLPKRIYPEKIVLVAPTGGTDSCPISFRLYASNDLFVNSKVLLHEEIDNTTWKTSNTIIWPEDDSSRNGMIIDINTAKDRYADTYQYGTPPTVNYNETYDLFVLLSLIHI